MRAIGWVAVTAAVVVIAAAAYLRRRDVMISNPLPVRPERQAVKYAIDPGASAIGTPLKADLGTLLAQPRPVALAGPGRLEVRYGPLETTLWKVRVRVTEVVEREDGDTYLTIVDAKGNRTVAEFPPPQRCRGSRFEKQIRISHEQVRRKFRPTRQPRTVDVPIEITGIGYFGRASVTNGARIQPVLSFVML